MAMDGPQNNSIELLQKMFSAFIKESIVQDKLKNIDEKEINFHINIFQQKKLNYLYFYNLQEYIPTLTSDRIDYILKIIERVITNCPTITTLEIGLFITDPNGVENAVKINKLLLNVPHSISALSIPGPEMSLHLINVNPQAVKIILDLQDLLKKKQPVTVLPAAYVPMQKIAIETNQQISDYLESIELRQALITSVQSKRYLTEAAVKSYKELNQRAESLKEELKTTKDGKLSPLLKQKCDTYLSDALYFKKNVLQKLLGSKPSARKFNPF